jgi:hypothetical protein
MAVWMRHTSGSRAVEVTNCTVEIDWLPGTSPSYQQHIMELMHYIQVNTLLVEERPAVDLRFKG